MGATPSSEGTSKKKYTLEELQALGAKPVDKQQGAFTYDVPKKEIPRSEKISKYQAEAQTAETEAKKANSLGGMAANFGKAFVKNIAPSEVGLGQTIAKLDNKPRQQYLDSLISTQNIQANLVRSIREAEDVGRDTTKLKQIYNDNLQQIKSLEASLMETNDLPTTSKVLGQLGGTALDVATAGTYGKATTGMKSVKLAPKASTATTKLATSAGLPELGVIAKQKATGLFTKKGALNVAKGAGIGYASDVTQGVQGLRGEDRTGSKAFIPGLSTAIGVGLPAISETAQSVKNVRNPEVKAQKLITKRQKGLNQLDSYQGLKKAVEKGRERGIDIKKVLSETDVLHGAVDKTGTITTKGDGGAVEMYTKEFIDGNESIVSDLLKKESRAIAPQVVEKKLTQAVMDAGIEGAALTQAKQKIKDELAGYSIRAGSNGTIPVSTLHDAKVDKYNNINFFTEGNTKKYDKTIAKALKELVEENTTSADIKNINKELSKHFAVVDYLNKLDNKKVSGGKLGKLFAQTTGAIVGSHFGALGAIVGAETGAGIKGNMMSQSFSGKTGKIQPQAEVITEALKVKNAPNLMLPQSRSNNLGSLNTNQSTTINPTNSGILNNIPRKKK